MALQIIGNGGVIADVDGTVFRAQRGTPRPTDYGTLGHYSLGVFTGIIPAALTANSELFQFRWSGSASNLAVVQKVVVAASVSTTFFAAGVPVQIDLVKSTGWSGAGTGGTGITMGATLKERTSMGSSLMTAGDIRIATTAALGAGTKSLEANSLGAIAAPGPITASLAPQIIAPGTVLFQPNAGDGHHPLVLVQNEGFSIRGVAVPATGTWSLSVQVHWAEVVGY